MVQTRFARKGRNPRKGLPTRWWRWTKIVLATVAALAVVYHLVILFQVVRYRSVNPGSTAMMNQRAREASARGEEPRGSDLGSYDRIRKPGRAGLQGKLAVLRSKGFDWRDERLSAGLERGQSSGGLQISHSSREPLLSTSRIPSQASEDCHRERRCLGKRRLLGLLHGSSGVMASMGAEARGRNDSRRGVVVAPDQAAFCQRHSEPKRAFNPPPGGDECAAQKPYLSDDAPLS